MLCFHNEGFDAYGTDVSENAGEILPDELKKKIESNSFTKTNYDNESFDVITLKQVLEHFIAPEEVLSEVHRILKPDGILYIEVPNTRCLKSKVFKQFWFNLEVPRHLYHFNLDNFINFVRRNGFKVSEILGGRGIMIFRTPLAFIKSFYFHLKNRRNTGMAFIANIFFLICFFPLLITTLFYRLLSTSDKQTDIRLIFHKDV